MTDLKRRGLLAGLVTGGAAIGSTAVAQSIATPQSHVPQPPVTDLTVTEPARLRVQPATCKPPTDWSNLGRYRPANLVSSALPASQRRVVFMGNSLTDNWAALGYQPEFFLPNGFVGRGIGGQTTAQMLVRFWPDVVALKPKVVHILAGTNDIAENDGLYDPAATTGNISAMCSIAKANEIKVVIGSVLPATEFPWRKGVGNPTDKILKLNSWLKDYAASQRFGYADYWPVLNNGQNGLKSDLALDGVHPNRAGYLAMAPVAMAAINKAFKA
ncbi:SGNH/GDSL hydrolase family protein [Asticcacaulis sp. ZE23SCel15]|uniref:SGNH/GDSL hydrolase family protein n=1 Tax=Asticcacaulis sp. ZE23SCel15 TaxID=3059027 RepID=UPI00265F5E44|nr:SGNH/GDSL hydrolase family protein [Asticcacaulis sp. ZE23SCel15]WKL57160.1 SGNH/GDSL hydrolase family protein [Asticcacaulis sp. ZE23SCel15]